MSARHDDFKCFKDAGYQFAITRAYRSYGAVDLDGLHNLELAKAAGLIGDVYFFPCKGSKYQFNIHRKDSKVISIRICTSLW